MTTPEVKPVTTGDVAPYAKRGCRTCDGKGEFQRVLPGGKRAGRACGCAVRRFLKARRADIKIEKNGDLIWKPVGDVAAPDVDASGVPYPR